MDKRVSLKVNGQEIPLNDFVERVWLNVVEGLVNALDKIPPERGKGPRSSLASRPRGHPYHHHNGSHGLFETCPARSRTLEDGPVLHM